MALAEYPEKPITVICWSSAGSSHDLMARVIAKVAEQYLGQPLAVINKEGGSGKVAMSYVLDQRPDGYTIMTNTRSMTTLLAEPGSSIGVDDFKYVSRLVRDPFVVTVREDSPFKTIEELVAYARANPNKLTMGGFSIKSVDEGLVKEFEEKAGIDLNYIPYRGGSEPVVAVLGGHIDAVVSNPSEVIPNFKAGKLRVLALAAEQAFPPFDNVPTLRSKGYPVVVEHWRGVMVAKDVPDDIVAKLDAALVKVAANPEFRQFLVNASMQDGYLPGKEFAELVKSQIDGLSGR
jgi:tripartite-type tricarboxylate transporter receptor subunit TctC